MTQVIEFKTIGDIYTLLENNSVKDFLIRGFRWTSNEENGDKLGELLFTKSAEESLDGIWTPFLMRKEKHIMLMRDDDLAKTVEFVKHDNILPG